MEIKFRAWDIEQKLMARVFLMDLGNGDVTLDDAVDPDHSWRFSDEVKLMQFTGLYDKNGVEIYDGDILEVPDHINMVGFERALVFWENGSYRIRTRVLDDLFPGYKEDDMDYNFLVVGNKYQNPDLIP